LNTSLINQEAQKLEENFKQAFALLNEQQQTAVMQTEGPVMVIAGPGTGKTQVLSLRIANILRDPDLQVNPSEILCLTFTESGVLAMRERLEKFIGSAAYQVGIFTFHSFCNQVIQENKDLFYLKNQIDDLEKIQIVEDILDNEIEAISPIKPFGNNYIYLRESLSYFQTLKQENIKPDEFIKAVKKENDFFTKYKDLLDSIKQTNARTLKKDPEIMTKFFTSLESCKDQYPEFYQLFLDFNEQSETAKDFKDKLKKYYEKTEKQMPRLLEIYKIYKSYSEKLLDLKLYDYEDMIMHVISKFKTNENFLLKYQERYQYFLVDEYQDTNGAQSDLVELLSSYYKEKANLFIVGDDDQSIYRFQGASLENIFDFSDRFKNNLFSVVLEKNYRSNQDILDTASHLIGHNQTRIINKLTSLNKNLESQINNKDHDDFMVEHRISNSKQDQYFHLAKSIKQLQEQGVALKDIAIIYRENKEAQEISDYLNSFKIFSKTQVSENILQEILIKQFIDLLELIADPHKNIYNLFLVLNYNFILESSDFKDRKIELIEIFKLTKKLKKDPDKSFLETIYEDERFKFFIEKILKFHKEKYNYKLDHFIEIIAKEFGLINYIFKSTDKILQLNYFSSFYSFCKQQIQKNAFLENNPFLNYELKDFLAHLKLMQKNNLSISPSAIEANVDAVNLMTAHRSKGLEFDYVFIPSLQDKYWGNKTSRKNLQFPSFLLKQSEAIKSFDPLEEERRLFFVAMTRAKKQLCFYSYTHDHNAKAISKSVFLSELSAQVKQTNIELGLEEQLDKLNIITHEQNPDFEFQEKEFLRSISENYRLSVTHLNNYIDCPRKFFYQNFIKIPSAKVKHAALGTAVHNALCELFELCKEKKLELETALEFTNKQFIMHLEKESLIKAEFIETKAQGLEILSAYLKRYFYEFNFEALLEYDFTNLNLVFDNFLLSGKLDKIEILKDNKVNVVDYKTGTVNAAQFKPGGSSHRQIVFYQLLCDLAKKNSPNFKYTMVSGELDYVKKQGDNFRKEKIEVSEKDLEQLKTEISNFRQSLDALNFPMTNEIKTCDFCSFKNICNR
jgi:DNA helicase-2/ATP-dependent DNA helicase PcrA